MRYNKPSLTLEQQADLLITRGLTANRAELIERLRVVSYYRLSGYLYPYRVRIHDAAGKVIKVEDNFVPGTDLPTVWRRCNFDRRFRILLLDAIERIEVAVRSRFVYHFTLAHGPFGHLDRRNLPDFEEHGAWRYLMRNLRLLVTLRGRERTNYTQWRQKLRREKSRSSQEFVKKFRKTYGDCHEDLPLWMACELMTCESLLQFAYGVPDAIRKAVAADFGFSDEQLMSWTKAVFTLRNSCAHHARVWDRTVGVKPALPGNKNKFPQWRTKPGFDTERIGLLMTVCHVWLCKITPTTQWRTRLFALFDEYPEIPLSDMGLPSAWRAHSLWQIPPA